MYQKTKKKLWVSFLCLIVICIVKIGRAHV